MSRRRNPPSRYNSPGVPASLHVMPNYRRTFMIEATRRMTLR
jgi:hypothetical protein